MQDLNEAATQQSPVNISLSTIDMINYDSVSNYSNGSSTVNSEFVAARIGRHERERQLTIPSETSNNHINLQISVITGNFSLF